MTGRLKKVNKIFYQKGIYLFLLCLLVYNINRREISSWDTLSSRYLPISIIKEFNLDLDEFPHLYNESRKSGYRKAPEYDTPYYLTKINNHYYSNYSIFTPVLAVPVYFIPICLGLPINGVTVDMLSKFTATIFAGLSVLFLYLALREITKTKIALFVSCIYAFATSTWSISSQGLWEHGPVELFLALTVYLLIKGIKEEKYALYSAIPLGLAVLCRQNSIIIAVVLMFYMFFKHRKHFLMFMIILSIFGVILIAYNLYFFGHVIGGNYYLQQHHHIPYYKLESKGIWSSPALEGLIGLLFNPNRGLLIYSPVLIFAFLGIFYVWRYNKSLLFKFLSGSIIVFTVFLSKFSTWWGGHCFGPRYFTDILPLLCLFMVFALEKIHKRRLLMIVFTVLSIFSLCVQTVGAFLCPSGWNYTLEDKDGFHPERLWNWKDSQLVWCVKKGFHDKKFLLEREKAGIKKREKSGFYLFPGQKIDFRMLSSCKHCEYGWSIPETWGTWATGPESLILLNFNNIKDRQLTIKAKSFKKNGKNQILTIYLNNNLLKKYVFRHPMTEWEIIEVKIPGKFFNGEIEELKFVYSHLRRAAIRDDRSIAMGVEYIHEKSMIYK